MREHHSSIPNGVSVRIAWWWLHLIHAVPGKACMYMIILMDMNKAMYYYLIIEIMP